MEVINTILFKKISAKGLGVYRIAYTLTLLLEIIHINKYKQLYFDKIPYLNSYFPDVTLLFFLWMGILVFLILGLYTKLASILNYIFTLVFISTMTSFEYHMHYVYTGLNLLLIFLPVHTSFSIDLLIKKNRYLDKGLIYQAPKVPKIVYFLPIFMAIALVYFDSVIVYKTRFPMWLRGLGLWLPSSLPHVTISDNQWFLNQEILVKTFSYITMTFEFMFIFLFWQKKYRLMLLIIGMILHIGIGIQFPIPLFSICYVALYLLMVPVSFWDNIANYFAKRGQKATLYYDERKTNERKMILVIKTLDLFKTIKLVPDHTILEKEYNQESFILITKQNDQYSGDECWDQISKLIPLFFPIILIQKIYPNLIPMEKDESIKDNKVFLDLQEEKSVKTDKIRNVFYVFLIVFASIGQVQVHVDFFGTGKGYANTANQFLLKVFGITKHPVFMDSHFEGYNTIYSVKYKGEFLPVLNQKGMPDAYLTGGVYINWLFRVNMPYIRENSAFLRNGLIRYTSFWAHRNQINISEHQEFEIVRKKIKVSFKWEKDLLKKNIESPWEKAGVLIWNKRKATILGLKK